MRITPACAGKRSAHYRQRANSGDHPRMCGEKLTKEQEARLVEGSPPHVRGKDPAVGERL